MFCTANPEGRDSDIVLNYARLVREDSSAKPKTVQPLIKTLKILWSDFVDIYAKDMKLGAEDLAPPTAAEADLFITDAEIGRRRSG